MGLEGVEVLCGGPIKSLFSGGVFDAGMRELVTETVAVLQAAGALVRSAHLAERFSIVDLSSQDVTRRDHAWCVSCDVYVALLPTDAEGTAYPSAGTAVELGWVSALGKPIVVLWDSSRPRAYSHLVRGLNAISPVVFLDLLEARANPGLLVETVERAGRSPGAGPKGGRLLAHGHPQ
ncbi:MAG: hypothetical protein HOV87_32360 [Catenulispora sp.]|nr:hypothetical protein [Catenulispora sp.]